MSDGPDKNYQVYTTVISIMVTHNSKDYSST